MRAGALRHRAEVLSLSADLAAVSHGHRWVGVRTKESADPPASAGLRARSLVEVRARFSPELLAFRYLRHGSRLFHITSARDFKGVRAELVITCEELVGEVATYTPPAGAALPCRVFLAHGVSRPGEFVGKSEYTTQLEAALIEVGRPQPGGVFLVGDQAWRVAGLVEDDDDRIVRRMWVKRI
jgi:head-tail adaptor